MKIETCFVYEIMKLCGSGKAWYTSNPDIAQEASRSGCRVTCKMMGKKIFK